MAVKPLQLMFLVLFAAAYILYALAVEYDRLDGVRNLPNRNLQAVSIALLLITVVGCCRINAGNMSHCDKEGLRKARFVLYFLIIPVLVLHGVFGIMLGTHTGARSDPWYEEWAMYTAIAGSSSVAALAVFCFLNQVFNNDDTTLLCTDFWIANA